MTTETTQTPEELAALRAKLESEHTNEGPVIEPEAKSIPAVIHLVATKLTRVFPEFGDDQCGISVTYAGLESAENNGFLVLKAYYPLAQSNLRAAQLGESPALVIAGADVDEASFGDFSIKGTPHIAMEGTLSAATYSQTGRFTFTISIPDIGSALPGTPAHLFAGQNEFDIDLDRRTALSILGGPVKLGTKLKLWIVD